MGIYDHKNPLNQTDTFGRPISYVYILSDYDYASNYTPPSDDKPKPKGRAAFAKFHAKDTRKPTLR